jgi:hypothetical protein
MDSGINDRLRTLTLNEQGCEESNQEEAKPFNPELFLDRYHQWSQDAEKKNKGALGVSFEAVNERYCVTSATCWGLSADEYRSGKHRAVVSPKPDHAVLCEQLQDLK